MPRTEGSDTQESILSPSHVQSDTAATPAGPGKSAWGARKEGGFSEQANSGTIVSVMERRAFPNWGCHREGKGQRPEHWVLAKGVIAHLRGVPQSLSSAVHLGTCAPPVAALGPSVEKGRWIFTQVPPS